MEQVRPAAIERLEKVVAVTPQHSQLHSLLATLYAAHDRDKAISQIQTALALSPKDSDVLSNVAIAYEAMGNRREAIRYALDSLKNGAKLAELQAQAGLQGVLSDPNFRAPGK